MFIPFVRLSRLLQGPSPVALGDKNTGATRSFEVESCKEVTYRVGMLPVSFGTRTGPCIEPCL